MPEVKRLYPELTASISNFQKAAGSVGQSLRPLEPRFVWGGVS